MARAVLVSGDAERYNRWSSIMSSVEQGPDRRRRRPFAIAALAVGAVAAGAGGAALVRVPPTPSVAAGPSAAPPTVASPSPGIGGEIEVRPHRSIERHGEQDADDEALSRSDIAMAMQRLKPRAMQCFTRFRHAGIASVKMAIAPSGRVAGAKAMGELAGSPIGECLEAVARTATFRAFRRPQQITLAWPFLGPPEAARD